MSVVLVPKLVELLHTAKRLVRDKMREHVTGGLPVRAIQMFGRTGAGNVQ
jgi:hypothetical protein